MFIVKLLFIAYLLSVFWIYKLCIFIGNWIFNNSCHVSKESCLVDRVDYCCAAEPYANVVHAAFSDRISTFQIYVNTKDLKKMHVDLKKMCVVLVGRFKPYRKNEVIRISDDDEIEIIYKLRSVYDSIYTIFENVYCMCRDILQILMMFSTFWKVFNKYIFRIIYITSGISDLKDDFDRIFHEYWDNFWELKY